MWYWDKSHKTNFMFAHKMPMAQVEEIAVFSEKMCVYYPQVDKSKIDNTPTSRKPHGSVLYRINIFTPSVKNQGLPSNLLCFPQQVTGFTGLQREHPTQKPESLMRYLVRTYTKEGETVLDPYMGSGTTGVACALEGRKFIGIEKEEKFFDIAVRRIEETYRKNKEFLDFGEVKE
jgi:site-specific DNA-methyltransferase (adenine-specific)